MSNIWWSGFKIGYERYKMSLLFTFKEFDTKKPVNHIAFKILGFFRLPQNSNSGCHKTSIFIYKVPFTLHPCIWLIYNNTNAKEQQIWPSGSIQKRALKLVLWHPEWKKGRYFSVFAQEECIWQSIPWSYIFLDDRGY